MFGWIPQPCGIISGAGGPGLDIIEKLNRMAEAPIPGPEFEGWLAMDDALGLLRDNAEDDEFVVASFTFNRDGAVRGEHSRCTGGKLGVP